MFDMEGDRDIPTPAIPNSVGVSHECPDRWIGQDSNENFPFFVPGATDASFSDIKRPSSLIIPNDVFLPVIPCTPANWDTNSIGSNPELFSSPMQLFPETPMESDLSTTLKTWTLSADSDSSQAGSGPSSPASEQSMGEKDIERIVSSIPFLSQLADFYPTTENQPNPACNLESPSKRKRVCLSPNARRLKHNEIEVRRRQKLRDSFEELRLLLGCEQKDKRSILASAIFFLKAFRCSGPSSIDNMNDSSSGPSMPGLLSAVSRLQILVSQKRESECQAEHLLPASSTSSHGQPQVSTCAQKSVISHSPASVTEQELAALRSFQTATQNM